MSVINTFINSTGSLRRQAPTTGVAAPRTLSASALAGEITSLVESISAGNHSRAVMNGGELARKVGLAAINSPRGDLRKLATAVFRLRAKLLTVPGLLTASQQAQVFHAPGAGFDSGFGSIAA